MNYRRRSLVVPGDLLEARLSRDGRNINHVATVRFRERTLLNGDLRRNQRNLEACASA